MIMARTLILIDPSSPHGEGGLNILTAADQAVTLLLTLDGRSAESLRDFANAEDIDVSMAGLIYLDQVASRASIHTDDIETISTLQQWPVNRVIGPASLPGLHATGLSRLLRVCPVPVVVAPRSGDNAPEFPMASSCV